MRTCAIGLSLILLAGCVTPAPVPPSMEQLRRPCLKDQQTCELETQHRIIVLDAKYELLREDIRDRNRIEALKVVAWFLLVGAVVGSGLYVGNMVKQDHGK